MRIAPNRGGPCRPPRTGPAARLPALVLSALLIAACSPQGGDEEGAERPTVVVTTTMLGDIVERVVAGQPVEVVTLMPAGADPHQYAPSAAQVELVHEADAIVVNGFGLEEGLLEVVDAAAADGVQVVDASAPVATLLVPGEGPDGAVDPHWFTDPARMAVAAGGVADRLGAIVPGLDDDAARGAADAAVADLERLDADAAAALDAVPEARRVMVTNHHVFGYFADRYDFAVAGVVIPSASTLAAPSARDLADLATLIIKEEVPAIFVESSAPTRVAEALATTSGVDVEVVTLYTESLGPADGPAATYEGMVRTNVERIVTALA